MKIKLTLEYDGSSFVGWQEQANGPGVQAELRVAIDTYLRSLAKRSGNALPNPVSVSGSGRTDSGVHALGQVASFSWPEALPFDQALVAHSVNGILPKQIAIRNLEVVEESFDARLTRHRKQYSYYFTLRRGSAGYYQGRAWRVRDDLDVRSMCIAARDFVGKHDFSSFRAVDCVAPSASRTLHVAELARENEHLLRFVVQGNGFLKQMIRIMAGTLYEIGTRARSVHAIKELLAAKDRALAGQTAPAYGLVLDWVRYDLQKNNPEQELEEEQ